MKNKNHPTTQTQLVSCLRQWLILMSATKAQWANDAKVFKECRRRNLRNSRSGWQGWHDAHDKSISLENSKDRREAAAIRLMKEWASGGFKP